MAVPPFADTLMSVRLATSPPSAKTDPQLVSPMPMALPSIAAAVDVADRDGAAVGRRRGHPAVPRRSGIRELHAVLPPVTSPTSTDVTFRGSSVHAHDLTASDHSRP